MGYATDELSFKDITLTESIAWRTEAMAKGCITPVLEVKDI